MMYCLSVNQLEQEIINYQLKLAAGEEFQNVTFVIASLGMSTIIFWHVKTLRFKSKKIESRFFKSTKI